ncbi:MAG: hypothetical protein R6V01_08405, partial [Thermoplasmatota archaeon]
MGRIRFPGALDAAADRIASGIAVYAIYQNKQLKKQIVKLKVTPTPNQKNTTPTIETTNNTSPESTEIPIPTPTPNPTENWKTY